MAKRKKQYKQLLHRASDLGFATVNYALDELEKLLKTKKKGH